MRVTPNLPHRLQGVRIAGVPGFGERLDDGEGASSLAKAKKKTEEGTEDAAALRSWRRRMGAEHVLEAARFVSELCDDP